MLPEEIVKAVNNIVSGIRAKDFVREISAFHRIQASPGIRDAMKYIKTQVKKFSDAEVKIYEYSADGKSKIESWENLYAWEPKSATLELIEPEVLFLADYEAEPISLAAFSQATDLEAEVVYVGKGLKDSDFDGIALEEKIVLTESRASTVHRTACIERGALGVLTFVAPSGKDEIAAMRRYEGIWPRSGEEAEIKFGFALKQADGVQIKRWLEEGKTVKVKAHVDAQLKKGINPVVSALIKGEDSSQEIWLIAHICHPHPGANDNASGSGAILEVFRIISRLLKEGVLEQPAFSLRFIWVPEWHGTIHFIENEKELLKRCRAVINVDMVGANPCKAGSTLNLHRTPYSLPTTLNNIVRFWMEKEAKRKRTRREGGTIAPLKTEYSVYSAGSDHFMFTDSTIGIPAVMLLQWPDKFYHTSEDTPDKIDPNQMSLVSRILTLSALTLAYPKRVTKETVLTQVGLEASELLNKICVHGVDYLAKCLEDPEEVYPRLIRWLGFAQTLSTATLEKALKEWPLIEVQKALREAIRSSIDMEFTTKMMIARRAYEGACAEVGLEAKDDHLPDIGKIGLEVEIKRKMKHALSPSFVAESVEGGIVKYNELREKFPDIFNRIDEILNLSVEWTTLSEIWDKLCFQFGHMEPKILLEVVDDLSSIAVIEIREV